MVQPLQKPKEPVQLLATQQLATKSPLPSATASEPENNDFEVVSDGFQHLDDEVKEAKATSGRTKDFQAVIRPSEVIRDV